MYALILMVFLQHGDCLGCAPDLVSISTTPGFGSLSACQAAGKRIIARNKGSRSRVEFDCVRQSE